MTKKISKDWHKWIKVNLDRGCDLDEMHAILMKEGFAPPDIKKSLRYEPVFSGLEENDVLSKKSKTSFLKKIKSLYDEYKVVKKRLIDEKNLESSTSEDAIDKFYKLDTPLAEIYCINDFLNKNECEELIRIIKKRLKPSSIVISGIEEDKNFRTSRTCDLGNLDNPLIKEIDRRICEFIGIDQKFSEMIQGQYYEVGEEFKSHTDFFEKDQMQNFTKKNGQRTFTFMVYLNDVEEGGETEFINLNRVFTPKQGTALSWNNLTSTGLGNHNTMHQAHPIKKGNKAVITKWFRERNGEEIFRKEPSWSVTNYTDRGFKKAELDKTLFSEIINFYSQNKNDEKREHIDGNFVYIPDSKEEASKLIELPRELKEKVHTTLKEPLEKWSNTSLDATFVYGIRVYQEGAVLVPHRDREETHIISAIINIDQEINEDWPLIIEDHLYRKHELTLKPGEVLYYESAKLLHGRPIPLNGKSFANIFCHFMPAKDS